jgi:hypothetical protein
MCPYPHIFTAGLSLQGAAVDETGDLVPSANSGAVVIWFPVGALGYFPSRPRWGQVFEVFSANILVRFSNILRPNIRTSCANMYRGVRKRTQEPGRHQDYSSVDGNQRQYFFLCGSQKILIFKPFINILLRISLLLEHKWRRNISLRSFGINIFFSFAIS